MKTYYSIYFMPPPQKFMLNYYTGEIICSNLQVPMMFMHGHMFWDFVIIHCL